MANAATATAPTAQTAADHCRNHLATTIIVTLYAALLLTGLALSVLDLRAPVSSSELSSTAPTVGNSAGWPLPSNVWQPRHAAVRG